MPGVTKTMPSSSSSASTVSDALANLTKAATVALNVVQGAREQAHEELACMREERDSALKALHDVQLDAKDLEVREEAWKAALDKSDLTVKHQGETINQLRAEVQQWKMQLARLEDSSRQEIDGWKEQYRRAEHERTRLSARIEELIAGQLAWNAAAHAYTAPFTPRMAYANIDDLAASSSATKRASTSHSHRAGTDHAKLVEEDDLPPAPSTSRKSKGPHSSRSVAHADRDQHDSPRPSTVRRKAPTTLGGGEPSASRATPRTPGVAGPSKQQYPRQRVIRRVTAVVDVKEEDTDGGLDDLESAASGSVFDPEDRSPIPPTGRRRRTSKAPTRKKRAVQDFVDEDEDEDEDVVHEDEGVGDVEDGEEDDELLLGSKSKKPPRGPAPGSKQTRTNAGPKKRKMDADASVAYGRAGPAKAAKTR